MVHVKKKKDMRTPEVTDAEPPKSWIWKLAEMDETRGRFLCAGPKESSPMDMSRLRAVEGPVDVFMLARLKLDNSL